MSGVNVEMVLKQPSEERWMDPLLLSVTDAAGRYAIDGIPPGEYYLGISVRSTPTKDHAYPPTYYPGTNDIAQATAVTFMSGALVQSCDLIAPPRLRVITLRGRIITPPGSTPKPPVAVVIKGPDLFEQIDAGPISIDADGRFRMLLCEGVRYSAFASAGPLRDIVYSAPREFIAEEKDSELLFVLDKSAKEFLELSRGLALR